MLAQPLKDQIEAIKQAEQDALDPLQAQTLEYEKQQHALDAQERSLQKIAAAIKQGADAGGGGAAVPDTTPFPALADVAPGTNKVAEAIDNVNNKLKEFEQWWKDHVTPALQEAHRVLVEDVIPALGRLKDALGEAKDALKDVYDWLQPKLVAALDAVTDAGKRLTDWLGQIFNPLLADAKKILVALMPVLQDLSPLVGTQLKTDFLELEIVMTPVEITLKEIGFYADTVLKPILVGLSDIISRSLSGNLTALHLLLTNFVNPALNLVGDTFTKVLTPAVADIGTKIDAFTSKLGDLKNWVEQNWADVGTKLAAPFTSAWEKIKDFFGNLYTGIKWLADHFGLSTPAAPSFLSADNGQSSGGSAGSFAPIPTGGTGPKAESGRLNAGAGHWSWVGERGPEMMYVPKGASILPNHLSTALAGVPGHAEGFNVDSVFAPLGAVVAGTAGKFVDTLVNKLPGISFPGVPDGAAALLKELRSGLGNWLANAPGQIAHAVVSGITGSGGALAPLTGLIKAAAEKYNEPADIIGAIILHESGGVIGRTEIGGGKGRGLMQVDGGTWPQAYDPRMVGTTLDDAAFQIDTGAMILGRGWVPNDIVQSLRNYSGAGFDSVHGRSFYQELIDMGLIAAADAALAGGGGAGGGGAAGVVGDAVNAMISFAEANSGQRYVWGGGHGNRNGFDCSGFVAAILDAGGITNPHGIVSDFYNWMRVGRRGPVTIGVNDPYADPTVQHMGIGLNGQWYEMGGRAGGSGRTSDYFSIHGTPPGLAAGGMSVGGQPRLVMVGDGPTGQREFHTPEPDLRQIVRDESSAMQIESGAFTFHIHPTPGMSEERVAELAAEAVHDVMIRGPQQRGRAA
jgi:hypothetical protein